MQKYNLSMRVFHWLVSIIILTLLFVGFTMTGMPASDSKWQVYALHKSFGVLALIIVIMRVINRMKSEIPDYPVELNSRDIILSKMTVHALYLIMILMPLSGYLMSSLGGYPVVFFGYTLPVWLPIKQDLATFFHSTHGFLGILLSVLIGLHLLGTIKHYLIERVNLLKRMW